VFPVALSDANTELSTEELLRFNPSRQNACFLLAAVLIFGGILGAAGL
jgi:hypothetical protein